MLQLIVEKQFSFLEFSRILIFLFVAHWLLLFTDEIEILIQQYLVTFNLLVRAQLEKQFSPRDHQFP